MIKTNLVAGFLGSGKTTLIRNFLASRRGGEKVALLVNELGEASLDAATLKAAKGRALELTNGCICCQVSNEFVVAMKTLAAHKPDRILIESTGISEPERILRALAESPSLRGQFAVEPTVVVIDAAGFFALFQTLAYYYLMQIKAADIVVLNKVDVATRTQVVEAAQEIRRLNPKALIVRARRGKVDLWGMLEGGGRGPGFESLHLRLPGTLDPAGLRRFLQSLPDGIYRARGTVRFPGGPARVEYLTGSYDQEPASRCADSLSELVFIGSKVDARRLGAGVKRTVLHEN